MAQQFRVNLAASSHSFLTSDGAFLSTGDDHNAFLFEINGVQRTLTVGQSIRIPIAR